MTKELKKLNPTQHSIMRYLSRKYEEIIPTDNAFKIWREKNFEKYEKGLNELIELSTKCDLVFVEKYNRDNEEREYRIHQESMSILVCTKDRILTYYPANFGEEMATINKDIFFLFVEQRRELLSNKEEIESRNEEVLEWQQNQINNINELLNLKREEIKTLEAEKESIKKKIDVHFGEVTEIETKIKIIERKIVHPRNAFSTHFKESED